MFGLDRIVSVGFADRETFRETEGNPADFSRIRGIVIVMSPAELSERMRERVMKVVRLINDDFDHKFTRISLIIFLTSCGGR